jgi:hypothetical protein
VQITTPVLFGGLLCSKKPPPQLKVYQSEICPITRC